ncbi:hypothetical protein SCIM_0822 [Streptococcus intermedius JTH08]|nr:hypothetical protein SCIM_0822 [Streptococcus intermedius JTH08]
MLTISSKFFWFNSIRLHLLRSLVLKFFCVVQSRGLYLYNRSCCSIGGSKEKYSNFYIRISYLANIIKFLFCYSICAIKSFKSVAPTLSPASSKHVNAC